MTWVEWFVVAAYATLVFELVLLPIPSEASTLQLFVPSDEARTVSRDDALAAARRHSSAQKVWRYLLPTAACVVLFLLPLGCIFVPPLADWLGCRTGTATSVLGAVLIGLGRAVTLSATVQLRRAKRKGGGLPGGLFAWSRNPGLVGMFTFYLGLCFVFGALVLWLGLPLYLVNMHGRVRLEEAHLGSLYGPRWRDYAARVPRYVGWRRPAALPPVDQQQVAAWFDATYRRKGLAYLRPPRAYPIFVQLLRCSRGERLLDIACGPGLLLQAALERGLHASGVDISETAIAMANRQLPDADARCGNAEALPFPNAVFDGVTCLGSIERFLDRERALREMLRVAKPDARFCFLVRNASTFVWRVFREGLGHREVEGHQDAKTIDEWRALFMRVGFEVESVLPDQWPRQRWRHLLPWWRPRPGRREPVARPLWPLRWCNELVFVLRRSRCGTREGA